MGAASVERGDRARERLVCHASVMRPFTDRLLRSAGAKPGASVLDLSTRDGDVALLAAKIVGLSGRVISIDGDANIVARARRRIGNAEARNITCVEADLLSPPLGGFDLCIGRHVLMYCEDPAAVVRAAARAVRPGGAVAFHELHVVDGPSFSAWTNLPASFTEAADAHVARLRQRVQSNLGARLPAIFTEAGLDISGWHFELAAPVLHRHDAAQLAPSVLRLYADPRSLDGEDEPDAAAHASWWRNAPAHAALTLPAAVLGWARRPA